MLREAAADLEWLSGLYAYFDRLAPTPETRDQCAIDLVDELLAQGLCEIREATFGNPERVVSLSRGRLRDLITSTPEPNYTVSLHATEAGKQWVRRYEMLLDELIVE